MRKSKKVMGSQRTKPVRQSPKTLRTNKPKGKSKPAHVERRTRSGKVLNFTKPRDFYIGRVTVVSKLKQPAKKVSITNEKLKSGVYKRTVIRGNAKITVYRKYLNKKEEVKGFLTRKHKDFLKGRDPESTISGMVQHVAGRVVNKFKGTLGKGSQAKKGSYLKSVKREKLQAMKKSARDVRINNRITDAEKELEAIEQEYAIRYFF
jgi:hypothetical protein